MNLYFLIRLSLHSPVSILLSPAETEGALSVSVPVDTVRVASASANFSDKFLILRYLCFLLCKFIAVFSTRTRVALGVKR